MFQRNLHQLHFSHLGILFPAKPFDTARELQNKSAAKLTSYLKSDESKISITQIHLQIVHKLFLEN